MEFTVGHEITVENYNALRKAVGWAELEPSQAQTGLLNSRYLVTAVREGAPVGMVRVVGDGGYMVFLVDVIVLPACQGNGIGRTLMRHAMEFIRAGLKEGQGAYVCLMAAKGKEGFYKPFGFAERPDEISGAGMSQWIWK